MDTSSKQWLLGRFAATFLRLNPMQLELTGPLEYEAEALSVLSRFVEAALQIPEAGEETSSLALLIVKQSMEFWFDDVGKVDLTALAAELLDTYRQAFDATKETDR